MKRNYRRWRSRVWLAGEIFESIRPHRAQFSAHWSQNIAYHKSSWRAISNETCVQAKCLLSRKRMLSLQKLSKGDDACNWAFALTKLLHRPIAQHMHIILKHSCHKTNYRIYLAIFRTCSSKVKCCCWAWSITTVFAVRLRHKKWTESRQSKHEKCKFLKFGPRSSAQHESAVVKNCPSQGRGVEGKT